MLMETADLHKGQLLRLKGQLLDITDIIDRQRISDHSELCALYNKICSHLKKGKVLGRSSVRRSTKARHRNEWCSTVSSCAWKSGHSEQTSTHILLRYAFRGAFVLISFFKQLDEIFIFIDSKTTF